MLKIEDELDKIYQELLKQDALAMQIAKSVHPDFRKSAMNLVRYMVLRQFDLRRLHDTLSEWGISSLRSGEGYVFRNVTDARRLVKFLNTSKNGTLGKVETIGYKKSKKLLRKNTARLFDSKNRIPPTKIMVTLPTEAAHDKKLLQDLIANGMEIARINLSHDDVKVWMKMVGNIKKARKKTGRPCKIYMDMPGPKIRTGKTASKGKKGKPRDFIRLRKDDHLILTKQKTTGYEATYDKKGKLKSPAKVSISIPSIIDDLKVGHRVMFDDGKIDGKVIGKKKNEVKIHIKDAPKKGKKLKSEKGVNVPDTILNLPSLTKDDKSYLPFIVKHADMVGYSFVRTPDDVEYLLKELKKYPKQNLGLILKIENQEAFENLPLILLAAMKRPKVGVMIARGDLMVEIGPERIAEVQDEIMWVCQSAHVPVIWATQVLENLAKTGNVSRAEITDAAKSVSAECVMLNKGEYIVKAVQTLQTILTKMETHTSKKKSRMRPLEVAKLNVKRVGQFVKK